MARVVVRARAIRWVSDEPPGWIEVSLADADGREHRIVEKVPVLTVGELTSVSPFPIQLWIRATLHSMDGKRLRVALDADVETTTGLTELWCSIDDVSWL